MITLFPDLNVWLALSVGGHPHSRETWHWLGLLPKEAHLIFSRYTQIGLLRLLTNRAVMGEQTVTVRRAWAVYDQWLDDPRVEFYPEPQDLDAGFREATSAFLGKPASKWIGDCYLLAYARQCGAALVTYDKALFALARTNGCSAISPG